MGKKEAAEAEEVVRLVESETENVEKNWSETNKHVKEHEGLLSKVANGLGGITDKLKEVSKIVAGTTLTVCLADAAKSSWDLNNSMTALSARMGQGAAGIGKLQDSVTGMMKSIGSSFKDAEQIVSTLAEAKYEGDLTEAAKSIDMYSRATGVTLGLSTQFTNQLSKQAGMSAKSSAALMAGMANVQQEVGISSNGMEALSTHIIDMTVNMSAFGKSSEEIKSATIKTTALVGAMEKVGIAAQETLSLVDRLTDPERIEDNILLYSQLGISMEDALTGNIEVTDDMLQGLGEKVKAMGPIAGNAFAQSLGMSYKDLTKMSKATDGIVDGIEEKANITEEEALGKLEELMGNAEGFGKKVGNFFNKVKGYIMGLGPVILTIGALLVPTFKKKASVFTEAISESVSSGINKGVDKSKLGRGSGKGEKAKKGFGESGQAILNDFNKANFEEYTALYESNKATYENLGGANKQGLTRKQRKQSKRAEQNMSFIENKFGMDNGQMDNYLEKLKEITELEGTQEKLKEKEQLLDQKTLEINRLKKDETLKGNSEALKKIESLEVEKSEINGQLEGLKNQNDQLKEAKKTVDDINKKMEGGGGESPGSKFGKAKQGLGGRVKAKVGKWKNDTIKNRMEKGKSVTGFKGKVGIAKDMAKGAGGKVAKGAAVAGGAIAIIANLLNKFMPELSEVFNGIFKEIFEILRAVFKPILPIISKLIKTLVKTLLPPLIKIIAGILRITMPLISLLMKALSFLPGIGDAFGEIAELTDTLGSQDFYDTLTGAADRISESNFDAAESTDKNTDQMAENQKKPPVISVEGGSAVLKSGGGAVVDDSAGSTTSNVRNNMSAEEKNNMAQQEQSSRNNAEQMTKQTKSLSKNESLLEIISQTLMELKRIIEEARRPNIPRDVYSVEQQTLSD